MTDQLGEAKLIAAKAREIPSMENRNAFLEQACSNDRDLLARVQALLEGETVRYSEPDRSAQTADFKEVGLYGEPVREPAEIGNSWDKGVTPESARRLAPLTIPGCEIFEVLGRGGMGVVYKAMQLGLKRWVALKMM